MKRFLSLLLALCFVLCLTACENRYTNSDTSGNVSHTQSTTDTSSKNGTITSNKTNGTESGTEAPTSSSKNSETSSTTTEPSGSSEPTENNQPNTQPDKSNEKVILPPIIDTHQEEYRPNYLLGNCRNLKGNPLVVLLFIDDDESNWSAEQVTDYTNNYINEGLRYLEDKAKEWGVDLDFSVKSYSTPLSEYTLKYEGVVIKDLRINGSSKDVLDQAAHDMGYSSNWELYSKFKTEHSDNNDVIFLTFLNKPGKSYARHMISTGQSSYSEHCVIFFDYLEGPSFGCKASTVAHEILHLFGAEDFYDGYREFLAYQIYPKDIMLWMPKEAYENEIGDFTAYTLGWTDTVPQICYNEYWWK